MTKKKDDELLMWLLAGGLFTITLIGIDIWYSSWSEMAQWYKIAVIVLHVILGFAWLGVIAHFKDPNYNDVRKFVLALAVTLIFGVGIHHALEKENKQVIIDSKESSE